MYQTINISPMGTYGNVLASIVCACSLVAGQDSLTPMNREGATMLTSLRRMVGLPVVWQNQQLGYVERAVPSTMGRRLAGIVVRKGLGGAKWATPDAISFVGENCVLLHAKPSHMPGVAESLLLRVFLTTGECVGEVSDVIITGETLSLVALEVSDGPFYRLLGKRAYATDFHLCSEAGRAGEVVVPKLVTWAELRQGLREEDDT